MVTTRRPCNVMQRTWSFGRKKLWQMIYCWCASNAQNYSCGDVDCVGLDSTMHWASCCSCFEHFMNIGVASKQIWSIKSPRIWFHWRACWLWRMCEWEPVDVAENHAAVCTILSIALIKNNFDWIVTLDVVALPRNIVRINSFATSEWGHMLRFFLLSHRNAYFAYNSMISFNRDVSIVSLC